MFGPTERIAIYLGGQPCEEKRETEAARVARRSKALEAADKNLMELEDRIRTGARVRKRHFTNVRNNIHAGTLRATCESGTGL